MLRRRTPEETAAILAYGFEPDEGGRIYPDVFEITVKTHDRPTLELASRLLRDRLAVVETEIASRP